MKAPSLVLSCMLIILCGLAPISDDNCKVLVPNLSGSFEGDCKNGMAHGNGKAVGIDTYEGDFKKGLPDGNGTYIWKNGDVYTGGWKKGLQNGEGKFKTSIDDADTVYIGMWKANDFVGLRPLKPRVIQKAGVDRHSFVRSDALINKMCITIYKNGDYNRTVSELNISGDSGVQLAQDQIACFQNFEIPFKCTLRYKTTNKLGNGIIDVFFDFEILQDGNWDVAVHN